MANGRLVLARRTGERLLIGADIVITPVACRNGQVRLLIEAPKDVQEIASREFARAAKEQREDVAKLNAELREKLSTAGLQYPRLFLCWTCSKPNRTFTVRYRCSGLDRGGGATKPLSMILMLLP